MNNKTLYLILAYLVCSTIIICELGNQKLVEALIIWLVASVVYYLGCVLFYVGNELRMEVKNDKKDIGIDTRPILEQLEEAFGGKNVKDK